jgi:hypothetical protein
MTSDVTRNEHLAHARKDENRSSMHVRIGQRLEVAEYLPTEQYAPANEDPR